MNRTQARQIIMKDGGAQLPEAAMAVLDDLQQLMASARTVVGAINGRSIMAFDANGLAALAELVSTSMSMLDYVHVDEWVDDERDGQAREAFQKLVQDDEPMADALKELRTALLGPSAVDE